MSVTSAADTGQLAAHTFLACWSSLVGEDAMLASSK
eukprot:CAMPEP_0182890478 /NCGR_PEP_ID=MMETSP0034_2-20130328/22683_1 /TAXON_ID=156128 /ORGANISM="Nephroselmis pyriformis, Strain CCMP717" /LENGTH=35 /DNA_ID= /DNA_START= /DNA_END= /DNA_ORIENTATION=